MNVASLFIEDLAILEHDLYICPPVSNIQILPLFDIFLNRCQIHWIVYNAHVVVKVIPQRILGDWFCECLGFFVIPHVPSDIPDLLSPVNCERELCELIIDRFLVLLINKSIINPQFVVLVFIE